MDYSHYQRLKFTRRERVLTISLNRPEVMNAVDRLMHDELATVFDKAQLDESVDVVVLTGEGEAFTAGGDVAFLAEMAGNPAEDGLSILTAKKIISSLLDLEKPIVARIVGPCIGLGASLALFCDVIYAAADARIGDPHVKMGLVAGDGGAVIWPQLVGYARAKQYLLTGDLLSGSEAERIGLVNYALPREELDDAVAAMADKLARGAPKAIRWTKAAVNIGLKQMASAIMDTALAYEFITFRSADQKEALAAFTEKRRPRFTGN